MLAAIAQHQPAITHIAYPNNPTATLWDEGAVAHHRRRARRAASWRWTRPTSLCQPHLADPHAGRAARNAHVLPMRTLSKFGLAGCAWATCSGPAALVAEIGTRCACPTT